MKRITMNIAKCMDCPHMAHFYTPGGDEDACTFNAVDDESARTIQDTLVIPDWCPLSDAPTEHHFHQSGNMVEE